MASPQEFGAPGRIRTRDPLVRSQVLYPTELPARRVVILRTLEDFVKSRDQKSMQGVHRLSTPQ